MCTSARQEKSRRLQEIAGEKEVFFFVLKNIIFSSLNFVFPSKQDGPEAGFTQRATWDEARQEMYVLGGLTRDRITGQDTVQNYFWLYVNSLAYIDKFLYVHLIFVE